jgi:hypothetical protein
MENHFTKVFSKSFQKVHSKNIRSFEIKIPKGYLGILAFFLLQDYIVLF